METVLEHILISTYKADMISNMYAHPEYFEESAVKFTSDGSLIVSVLYPEDEWIY